MYVLNRPMLDNYADSFMTLPKLQKGITEYNLVSTCKIPLTPLSKPLRGSSGVFCKGFIADPASAVGMGHGGTWVICIWGVQRIGGLVIALFTEIRNFF